MSFRRFAPYVCLAVLVGALGAVSANAATITLSMTYSTTTSADGLTHYGPLLSSDPSSVTPSDLNFFDVSFAISGNLPNEDFNAMQFDVFMGPGFAPAIPGDYAGYAPDTPQYNPAGAAPLAGIYSTNSDEGADTNDLQRIIVIGNSAASGVTPIAYMHGFRPGIVGTGRIGDLVMTFDKSLVPDGVTEVTVGPNGNIPWATYIGAVGTDQTAASFFTSDPFVVELPPGNNPPSIIPPGAITGVSQGDVLVGDFDAADVDTPLGPFTFSNLALSNFNPYDPFWPIPNPAFNAVLDPVTGEVTWDTTGFRRGVYDITVDVADQGPGAPLNGANNPGHWVVEITSVPEPSTLALFGLALVGCCGLGRRRS